MGHLLCRFAKNPYVPSHKHTEHIGLVRQRIESRFRYLQKAISWGQAVGSNTGACQEALVPNAGPRKADM